MARPLRLEHPGALWHVTARGNERGDVFRDDVDREEFLSVLGRTVSVYGWRLHAYVLMGNHYHLFVETPEPTLSRGMRDLNGITTQRFNRRHGRTGHLFEGRFKAILVEREAHFLEVARYVVLNPVRVGFSRSAASWPWSSYKATAGLAEAPEWLETGWTIEQFGRRPAEARRRYAAFVADGKGSGYDPWSQLRGQVFLGSEGFAREVGRRANLKTATKEVPRVQREPVTRTPDDVASSFAVARKVSLEEMAGAPRKHLVDRALLAWALRSRSRAPLAAIAGLLGVGIAQASVLVRRGEGLATGDAKLAAVVEKA
ncbi:MAG: transposase [Deltaproteobacteria bacterium]|nr:transposase [Deltaproteobacteria bacterium]